MIKLLQFLLFGHVHKWKIIARCPIEYEGWGTYYKATRYTLQCETCGDIKAKDAVT